MAEDVLGGFGVPPVGFVEDKTGSSHEVLAGLCVTPLPPTYALLRSAVGTLGPATALLSLTGPRPHKGGRQK